MIHNIDPQLTQWDVGRVVTVSDTNATHIHFANQGDSKAVIIEVIGGSAKIPDYLLQTGKSVIAYAVLDGVTLESKSFPVRKREMPESYVYEDDQRNYIYKLIADAETAVANANLAIESANEAADGANLATANAKVATYSANLATIEANGATENANIATKNANEAVTKANNAVKNMMVVGEANGESISIDNAINQTFVGLRVFGKTTQDGTPTPDAPVELVNVGMGGITVNVIGANDAQSMITATPNGLPGFPVSSGGNYTDANGQRWICDEVDFARGVYVQRVQRKIVSNFVPEKTANGTRYNAFQLDPAPHMGFVECFCRSLPFSYTVGTDSPFVTNGIRISPQYAGGTVVARWNDTVLNNLDVMYILATPIEIPLSEEELAAYANLHTYKDNTTVSNDAGAWMDVEYVMDAKKYIDRLVGGGIAPARVE